MKASEEELQEMKEIGEKDFGKSYEIYRYLRKQSPCESIVQDYLIAEYVRYLRYRNELGLSNESHSARFPSDIQKAYENISNLVEEKKKRERAEKIEALKNMNREYLESLSNLTVKDEHYSVVNPVTDEDFKELGDIFENCVGTMGYYEKQLKGRCAIFAIRKDGEYYACLEVGRRKNGKPMIEQLYTKRNQPCDKITRRFVNREIVPKINFSLAYTA